MSKSKLMAWLDAQIEARDAINIPFNDNVYTIDNTRKCIHLGEYDMIWDMCKTLGLDVVVETDYDTCYPYKAYFIYKDYEVFALSDGEEY